MKLRSLFKTIITFGLMTVYLSASSQAESLKTFQLLPGVKIDFPVSFHELSEEEIRGKFPPQRSQKRFIGNNDLGTTASCFLTSANATSQDLPSVSEKIAQALSSTTESINSQKMIIINGREYAFLDLWTLTADGRNRMINLITSFHGQALICSFSVFENQLENIRIITTAIHSLSVQ